MAFKSLRLFGLLVLAAATLSGCATSFVVDSSVQSFSGLTALPAQPTYRFDRLPSQQASQLQHQVEAMANPALARAGLRRDDSAPQLGVQVTARVQRTVSPWADPWDHWGGLYGGYGGYGPYSGYGGHGSMYGGWGGRWGGGFGIGSPFPRMEPPWFHREVAIVVRDLPTNRVVYETHAVNDGPWSDNAAVFPALFQAALQGFPTPPPGPRRVDVQIGP